MIDRVVIATKNPDKIPEIKAVLAVKKGELPPSLHFEEPNPRIDFESSPFYVNDRLRQAWSKLDAVEQFVLEAMIIEEQDAEDVLEALQSLDVSIKPGVAAADTNRQQLYYFKRKALSRLGIELNDL